MRDNEIQSSEIDESLFEVQLENVPSSEELKSRILQATEAMPQLHNAETVQEPSAGQDPSASNESLNKLKPSTVIKFFKPKYIAPLAVAASVALVAVLWVPTANQQSANHSNVIVSEDGFSTSDNLDFEEAMVLFDEQLFAQL